MRTSTPTTSREYAILQSLPLGALCAFWGRLPERAGAVKTGKPRIATDGPQGRDRRDLLVYCGYPSPQLDIGVAQGARSAKNVRLSDGHQRVTA